ncbi:MAG: NAD(+)/NADH kinase [Bdellovibrio sp.]|nr:NAD(+)/NADH kinase [Bdellovibrio sp.]
MAKKLASLKIKKVGLVIKHHQPKATALASEITAFLISKKIQVCFSEESALIARDQIRVLGCGKKQIRILEKPDLVDHCDLIVVLGGDGTFLSIARLMRSQSVPIMGINMGQLGFLTEIKKNEAIFTLSDILEGLPPVINHRSLLEVTLQRKNKIVFQGPVVNDAVVSKGAIARIIGLEVWVNDKWVHQVRADGLIVSTTTGSS